MKTGEKLLRIVILRGAGGSGEAAQQPGDSGNLLVVAQLAPLPPAPLTVTIRSDFSPVFILFAVMKIERFSHLNVF